MTTTAAGIRQWTLDNIMSSDVFGVKIDFSSLVAQHGAVTTVDCTYAAYNSFTLGTTTWSVSNTLLTVTAIPIRVNPQQVTCPSNCDEAKALGWTAQQAGQCANLDRDHDGEACYGN